MKQLENLSVCKGLAALEFPRALIPILDKYFCNVDKDV